MATRRIGSLVTRATSATENAIRSNATQRSPLWLRPPGAARIQLGHEIVVIEDQSVPRRRWLSAVSKRKSGGLHAWMTLERTVTGEALTARAIRHMAETYSPMWPNRLCSAKQSTNRWDLDALDNLVRGSRPSSQLGCRASTYTSHPPRRSETASCRTRRSPGTSAFSTMIRARRGRAGAEPVDVRPTDRRGARVVMATAIYAHGSARLHIRLRPSHLTRMAQARKRPSVQVANGRVGRSPYAAHADTAAVMDRRAACRGRRLP